MSHGVYVKRFMGIDYGTKRIGLAVADDESRVAMPVETITPGAAVKLQIAAVVASAAEYDIDEYVVGLPINMDGTEGLQVTITHHFGDQLQSTTGKPVHYFDERLSSHAADQLLNPAGFTNKKHKARRDAVAAQVILQGYINSVRG